MNEQIDTPEALEALLAIAGEMGEPVVVREGYRVWTLSQDDRAEWWGWSWRDEDDDEWRPRQVEHLRLPLTILYRPDAPAPFAITAEHIERQREFSIRTFGPGLRTEGVLDHIRKELDEVTAAPGDLSEWADVIILAFDGAQRTGADPQAILDAVLAKQERNEARTWPDWRTRPTDRAIEHDRSGDAPAPQPETAARAEAERDVETLRQYLLMDENYEEAEAAVKRLAAFVAQPRTVSAEADEWREGCAEQQKALQSMHEALLTIWRSADPGNRKYMTYQASDDVARETLDRLAAQPRTVSAEQVEAARDQVNAGPFTWLEQGAVRALLAALDITVAEAGERDAYDKRMPEWREQELVDEELQEALALENRDVAEAGDAQPRTVSAADLDALAHTYCRAGVDGDELARALDSIGVSITVAEPVEHRVTTEGLYNYWCACGWRYAHVGSGEPDEVAVAKHDAYVAEAGEGPAGIHVESVARYRNSEEWAKRSDGPEAGEVR